VLQHVRGSTQAYRKKGWAFKNANEIEQCVKEGWMADLQSQKDEGCRVYGHVIVNKVAGNFHFAPGKSFQQHHSHVHDLYPFAGVDSWNTSHIIHRFSFGTLFPGVVNPLDSVNKTLDQTGLAGGLYQYFIKVVPTVYQGLDDQMVIKTNQYSVTEHFRALSKSHEGHGSGLPGVFFMYDISPIMVKFTEHTRSFPHFLTGICAIIGGVFTVAGLLDSLIYNSMRSLGKKIELGKAM